MTRRFASMHSASLLMLTGCLLCLASASAITQIGPAPTSSSPDGTIVPFTSLPSCASLCGRLFDVQAACSPPVLPKVSQSCFCSNPSLLSFLNGTAGVSETCGASSCQDTASLQKIVDWYEGFCSKEVSQSTGTPTTTSAFTAPARATSSTSSTSITTPPALSTGTSINTTQSMTPTLRETNQGTTLAPSQSTNLAPSSVVGSRVAVACVLAAGILDWGL